MASRKGAARKKASKARERKPWREAVEQQINLGVRAEQQAFAKFHLNFVMDTYLSDKLSNVKGMLP